jgi:hypothetical protein
VAGEAGRDPALRERLLREGRRNAAITLHFSASDHLERGEFAARLVSASELLSARGRPGQGQAREASGGSLLVAYGPAELLPGCFLAGCNDYLKEPWTLEELEWRLRRLLPDSPRRYRFSWGSFTLNELDLRSPRGSCPLSWPQSRILRLLADQPGRVVPREALYCAIWGQGASRGSRVADVHVSGLRRKLLELFPSSAGALRSVRGQGYLLR